MEVLLGNGANIFLKNAVDESYALLLAIGGSDAYGGSSSPPPVLRKDPATWLRMCHNRAAALGKRRSQGSKPKKSHEELLAAGFSVEQATHYSQSYEKAKQRQQWLHAWDASMPPNSRQTFGLHGASGSGARVPLPPLARMPR